MNKLQIKLDEYRQAQDLLNNKLLEMVPMLKTILGEDVDNWNDLESIYQYTDGSIEVYFVDQWGTPYEMDIDAKIVKGFTE